MGIEIGKGLVQTLNFVQTMETSANAFVLPQISRGQEIPRTILLDDSSTVLKPAPREESIWMEKSAEIPVIDGILLNT